MQTEIGEQIKSLMLDKHLKLSAAESFTGGYLSSLLTAIPGASEYFYESLICYSSDSKIKRLGVDPQIIVRHGAVSFACCKDMLKGLLQNSCSVAVATTGYAGPLAEPTRLCFVGAAFRKNLDLPPQILIKRYFLGENRVENIKRGAILALKCVCELID